MWSRYEAEIHPLLEESGGLPKKNLIFILASLLQSAFWSTRDKSFSHEIGNFIQTMWWEKIRKYSSLFKVFYDKPAIFACLFPRLL